MEDNDDSYKNDTEIEDENNQTLNLAKLDDKIHLVFDYEMNNLK